MLALAARTFFIGKSTGFSANTDLSAMTSSDGFVINGLSAGGAFGISVNGAGDINFDGVDDFAIGARNL